MPAGLLVHKPGIACPHKHVEVAKHHRDVERPHVGELRDLTGDVTPLAECQRGADAIGVRGILHVLQALCPGG